jgi:hypothetical protein
MQLPHIARIAAALAIVAVPSVAMAAPAPPSFVIAQNYYGPWHGYEHVIDGRVSSFSPYNLYLMDGVHVVLHNGTVINPTGIHLHGGQRVHIVGHWGRDHRYHADRIDVVGFRHYYHG